MKLLVLSAGPYWLSSRHFQYTVFINFKMFVLCFLGLNGPTGASLIKVPRVTFGIGCKKHGSDVQVQNPQETGLALSAA